MKYTIRLIFTLWVSLALTLSQAENTALNDRFARLPSPPLGVEANNPALDDMMPLFAAPPPSKTGKSLLTMNKMGFDVLDTVKNDTNWLIAAYLQFIKVHQGTVLDIGCGYGNLALEALAHGNKVIANDIAVEHLIEVRRRAMAKHLPLNTLYLNNKTFPYAMDLADESVEAIVIYRVLHFLSPTAIEAGLSKAQRWLKPGGKLFIAALAPQNKSFSTWFLPIYNEKWSNGIKWPGVDLPTHTALPEQAYQLPPYLHVMDERPLRYALEKAGFKVDQVDFIDMRRYGQAKEERDGHEMIGMIAEKI